MVILRLFPWFAFLGEGQEASNGIYPVILYYKDFDELVLAYGISDTNEPHAQWQFSSDIPKTIAEYFQATSGVYPKNTDSPITPVPKKSHRVLIIPGLPPCWTT